MPVKVGLPRRRRRWSQGGFTLIEMLVVISILGILAAVVTMSMAGLTNLAQQRAKDGELLVVRAAMTAMMMDQQIDPADACTGSPPGGTNDMAQFPNPAPWTGQGTGKPVSLYPHYLHGRFTIRSYVCSGGSADPGP